MCCAAYTIGSKMYENSGTQAGKGQTHYLKVLKYSLKGS